jgi:hypothetical protein
MHLRGIWSKEKPTETWFNGGTGTDTGTHSTHWVLTPTTFWVGQFKNKLNRRTEEIPAKRADVFAMAGTSIFHLLMTQPPNSAPPAAPGTTIAPVTTDAMLGFKLN